MLFTLLRNLFRLWLLGILFILVISGYILYSCIWVIRLMQIKSHKFLIFAGVLFLISAGLFWYFFLPVRQSGESVEIYIPKNSTVHQIADSLEDHHVITSSKMLILWLKVTKSGKRIQAGKITLNAGDGVIRAAGKLFHAIPVEIEVTIPEGLTIEMTASRIHQVIPIDTAEFIRLCYDTSFVNKFIHGHPSLEGYLFPNTYRFSPDVKVGEIIRKMVSQFDRIYNTLTPDPQIESTYSEYQLVTLASIVEKEAAIAIEQPRIAGVFHNRLRMGYPLGADPTVRYAIKKFNGPLRVSELNCASLYNTRRYKGLPPGPICSPGKGALQAALAPMDTKELYFVAKWDGSGEHDFSVTNAEHTRKKLLIRQKNELRIKEKGCGVKK